MSRTIRALRIDANANEKPMGISANGFYKNVSLTHLLKMRKSEAQTGFLRATIRQHMYTRAILF